MMFDKVLDIVMPVFIVFALALFVIACVMAVFSTRADAICLAKGFPNSHVTWRLDTYCSTLDGAVTVKVEKQ